MLPAGEGCLHTLQTRVLEVFISSLLVIVTGGPVCVRVALGRGGRSFGTCHWVSLFVFSDRS